MIRLLSAIVCCLVLTLGLLRSGSAEITLTEAAGGGVTVKTGAYTAMVGADGYLASIRAGETEFLAPFAPWGSPTGLIDFCAPGNFGNLLDTLTRIPLGKPEIQAGNVVVAKDPDHEVRYSFREQDLEIAAKFGATNTRDAGQPPAGTNMLLCASPSVTRSFHGVTDRELDLNRDNVVGVWQEGMRWATPGGALLRWTEKVDGYASFMWWSQVPAMAQGLRGVSFPLDHNRAYTVTPLAKPQGADAVHFAVEGPNPGLLLPGGDPLAFRITAENLTPSGTPVSVDFEVRDYLTRAVVAGKHVDLKLPARGAAPVPTDVTLEQPGPYRAAIALRQGDKLDRDIEWIFTYDFPHYQPELTRPPDFKQFWQQALADLKAVPPDVQMTLNAEKSNEKVDVYEVSLASLDGRRVWGWYARPKQEGKYPVHYFCPPTGVYPLPLWVGDGGGQYCTFNIAIHGFDLRLSDMKPGDPWGGYHTLGIASPRTSAWRWIYAALVRCVDFLASRPEVDQDRIAVSGSSQGGGLAMVLAGLDPRIDLCLPKWSGLPRLDWTVRYNTGYWPFGMNAKPEGQSEEEFLQTLAYFDAANFTPDIQCPVAPYIGMLDWVTASGNQVCAMAHLKPGQVELICDPWGGHGSIGDRAAHARYTEIANALLTGQPVVLQPTK